MYRPKHCGNNNKNEDNSPKTLNDKNQQALYQKFRQLISSVEITIKLKTIVQKPLMIKINKLRLSGNNNKDEDNSPKTLNDKNHQASSQWK